MNETATITTKNDFRDFCYHQHDVVCNQKYNGYPYSIHLKAVRAQVRYYKNLLSEEELDIALNAAAGHDLIEDARVTYNDIVGNWGAILASIIYGCTESTGRTRKERHDEAYYERLTNNDLSVFVKLCDIKANVLFSMLTNSSMYSKYFSEFPHFTEKTYVARFNSMYRDINKLLTMDSSSYKNQSK